MLNAPVIYKHASPKKDSVDEYLYNVGTKIFEIIRQQRNTHSAHPDSLQSHRCMSGTRHRLFLQVRLLTLSLWFRACPWPAVDRQGLLRWTLSPNSLYFLEGFSAPPPAPRHIPRRGHLCFGARDKSMKTFLFCFLFS